MTVPTPPPNSIYWKEPWLCTYATCPLDEFGQLRYIPSLGANALFLAIFALGLLLQLGLAIRYRTWGYLIAMFGGCILEIVGYVGRIQLHINDFNNNYFIIYLVGCTIGPACFSAAIYLCLSRIIVIYGRGVAPLKPRLITIFFISCDLLSLVLQAAGGALASTANTNAAQDVGVNIMIAGLSTQLASTAAFVCVCAVLARSIHQNQSTLNPDTYRLRQSTVFKLFLAAIAWSTIAILIRCSFRVAELSGGFGGALANNQVLFMILDGTMMITLVIALTVAHPAITLGREIWEQGQFRVLKDAKSSKTYAPEMKPALG